MARNEEKSQSMLHRYLRSKENAAPPKRRPPRATLCDDVDQATHWLRQVVRDLRVGIAEIQNDSLEEGKLRDLNDGLNRLLRDRRAWERRVRALGGDVPADLAQPVTGPLATRPRHREQRRKRGRDGAPVGASGTGTRDDEDGDGDGDDAAQGVIEIDGFFYFGAARSLPGVAELAAKKEALRKGGAFADDERDEDAYEELQEPPRGLAARLDRTYFGLNERGETRADARQAEERLRARAVEQWEREHAGEPDGEADGGGDAKVYESADTPWDDSFHEFIGKRPETDSQADVMQDLLLERKKAEALELLQAGTRSGGSGVGKDTGKDTGKDAPS